jgi:hypothetical protein
MSALFQKWVRVPRSTLKGGGTRNTAAPGGTERGTGVEQSPEFLRKHPMPNGTLRGTEAEHSCSKAALKKAGVEQGKTRPGRVLPPPSKYRADHVRLSLSARQLPRTARSKRGRSSGPAWPSLRCESPGPSPARRDFTLAPLRVRWRSFSGPLVGARVRHLTPSSRSRRRAVLLLAGDRRKLAERGRDSSWKRA